MYDGYFGGVWVAILSVFSVIILLIFIGWIASLVS